MEETISALEDFDPAAILDAFDPAKMLPELEPALGQIETLLRLSILVGPILLLVLGILYFILPPREANHSFGYRFFWGMSSVESWRFTQRVAGLVWALLGLVLTVLMLMRSSQFPGMETMDMVWSAVRCILWELGLVAVSCLVIDVIVVVCFNARGVRREFTLPKKRAKREARK